MTVLVEFQHTLRTIKHAGDLGGCKFGWRKDVLEAGFDSLEDNSSISVWIHHRFNIKIDEDRNGQNESRSLFVYQVSGLSFSFAYI